MIIELVEPEDALLEFNSINDILVKESILNLDDVSYEVIKNESGLLSFINNLEELAGKINISIDHLNYVRIYKLYNYILLMDEAPDLLKLFFKSLDAILDDLK
jgi:hypothetical protein